MWLCALAPAGVVMAADASLFGSLLRSSLTTSGTSVDGTRDARVRALATLARKCGLLAHRMTSGTNGAVAVASAWPTRDPWHKACALKGVDGKLHNRTCHAMMKWSWRIRTNWCFRVMQKAHTKRAFFMHFFHIPGRSPTVYKHKGHSWSTSGLFPCSRRPNTRHNGQVSRVLLPASCSPSKISPTQPMRNISRHSRLVTSACSAPMPLLPPPAFNLASRSRMGYSTGCISALETAGSARASAAWSVALSSWDNRKG